MTGQCCEKASGPGRVCADCAEASRAYSADMRAPIPAPEGDALELAHRIAWRYKKSSDPTHSDTYTFNEATLLQFVAALAAQPEWRCPDTGRTCTAEDCGRECVQASAEAHGLLPLIERLEDAASAALTQAHNAGKVAHKAGIYMPAIETGAELARAIIALRDFAAAQSDVQPKGTPSSHWAAEGEPDPHGDRYACERAALTLGDLTDDELANGAFLNYNEPLNIKAVMENRPGYHPPIAWMTAVKDRIRWLSRALEKAKAVQAPAPAPAPAPAVPDGYALVAVKGFDDLMYWLDRCESKGHLENCADLIEPWAAFDWRDVAVPAPAVAHGKEAS